MTKKKSIDEILSGWDDFSRPQPGQIFQHYKGGKYNIVATGFLEDSQTPCVVYQSLSENITWVRTAKNFLEEVEHDGKKQPRFKLLD
jgi:hypothetical protein